MFCYDTETTYVFCTKLGKAHLKSFSAFLENSTYRANASELLPLRTIPNLSITFTEYKHKKKLLNQI